MRFATHPLGDDRFRVTGLVDDDDFTVIIMPVDDDTISVFVEGCEPCRIVFQNNEQYRVHIPPNRTEVEDVFVLALKCALENAHRLMVARDLTTSATSRRNLEMRLLRTHVREGIQCPMSRHPLQTTTVDGEMVDIELGTHPVRGAVTVSVSPIAMAANDDSLLSDWELHREEQIPSGVRERFTILHAGWATDNDGWIANDGHVYHTFCGGLPIPMSKSDIRDRIMETVASLYGMAKAMAVLEASPCPDDDNSTETHLED